MTFHAMATMAKRLEPFLRLCGPRTNPFKMEDLMKVLHLITSPVIYGDEVDVPLEAAVIAFHRMGGRASHPFLFSSTSSACVPDTSSETTRRCFCEQLKRTMR